MGRKSRNNAKANSNHTVAVSSQSENIDDVDTPEYLNELERLEAEEYYTRMYELFKNIKTAQLQVPIVENLTYDKLCDFTAELFEK